ncbi:MAG: DUF922 domain-containing protein [Spirochaetota bacterium]
MNAKPRPILRNFRFVLPLLLSLLLFSCPPPKSTDTKAQADPCVMSDGKNQRVQIAWSNFTEIESNDSRYSSPYSANIRWEISYRYNFREDAQGTRDMKFRTCAVINKERSWVKKDRQSDDLLKHEQGHMDLAIMYARILHQRLINATYNDASYKTQIKAIFNRLIIDCRDEQNRYDRETDHMLNRDKQREWDERFKRELG